VTRRAVCHFISREFAQLAVNKWQQLIGGLWVAVFGCRQQLGDGFIFHF